MCEYANLHNSKCNITFDICPYIYFCHRSKTYQPSKNMPTDCKIKQDSLIKKGEYRVLFERHGNLYIEVNDNVEIISNPYNYLPQYVKLKKDKQGKWYIKK